MPDPTDDATRGSSTPEGLARLRRRQIFGLILTGAALLVAVVLTVVGGLTYLVLA